MNKERKLYNIPLLTILTVFVTTYFIYNDFNLRFLYVVNYGILALLLLLVFISKIKNHQKIFNFSIVEIVYLIIPIIVLLNIVRPDTNRIGHVLKYGLTFVIATGFVLLAKVNENEEKYIFKTILIFTGIVAVFEIIYTFFPSIAQIAYNISSETGKEYNAGKIEKGWYPYSMGASLHYDQVMIMLGIAATIVLYYKDRKKSYILWGAFLFIAAVLIGKRAELLAITAAIVITLFILDNPKKRNKHLLIFLSALIGVIGLFILLMPVLKNVSFLSRYVDTVQNIYNGGDVTTGRFANFGRAWQAFTEHPFIGIGWGQFQPYTNATEGEVHNMYLQLLCESGIFVTLIIVAAVIFLFVITIILLNKSLKLNNDVKEKTRLCQLLIFAFFVQCFFLCCSFVDTIFTTLIFLLYYAITICFVSYSYNKYKNLNNIK